MCLYKFNQNGNLIVIKGKSEMKQFKIMLNEKKKHIQQRRSFHYKGIDSLSSC